MNNKSDWEVIDFKIADLPKTDYATLKDDVRLQVANMILIIENTLKSYYMPGAVDNIAKDIALQLYKAGYKRTMLKSKETQLKDMVLWLLMEYRDKKGLLNVQGIQALTMLREDFNIEKADEVFKDFCKGD